MTKLTDIKELKEEFTTNINKSDKFEKTKGIFKCFKSFCTNHKLLLAGLAIPTALMINMGLSNNQTNQQNFESMFANDVQNLVDQEYDKRSKMNLADQKPTQQTESFESMFAHDVKKIVDQEYDKREKLNSTKIVTHEINYDFADINSVLAEKEQSFKKEVKLGITAIKNNKIQN